MRSIILVAAALVAAGAQAQSNCSRSELQAAVDSYIEAQTAGDIDLLPVVPQTRYYQQQDEIDASDSIINEALAIDFHRSILDETTCQTFTELVVLDEDHPYAIGTRLRLVAGTVIELEALVTDEGDWLFNAGVYHDRASAETWHELQPAARSSRAALEAAGNAYFDQFFSGPGAGYVPWGRPCNRLEGGAYTGNGSPDDSCEVGMPSGMVISHRRFLVDEVMGTAVGFVRFGPNLIPDVHMFRLENGVIRYVHALTACPDTGCAFN